MTHIRTARYDDVAPIAARLRKRDIDEIAAATGHTPSEALTISLQESPLAWVMVHDGVPFAMFGAGDVSPGVGSPWLLATDDFKRHVRFVLRHIPVYMRLVRTQYPVLVNWVDCRNRDSIRFIRWLGYDFTAFDPEFGVERRPFLQFQSITHV